MPRLRRTRIFIMFKIFALSFFLLILLYICVDILVINENLFESAPGSNDGFVADDNTNYTKELCPTQYSDSQYSSSICNEDNVAVDVVYTWVNGSDPQLADALSNTINQLFIDELLQSFCTATTQDNVLANCSNLFVPILLVRPKLKNPTKHIANIIKFQHSYNENFTIIFFPHIQFVREHEKNCIRILDGKIYKFSSLFLLDDNNASYSNHNNSTVIKLDSLIKLNNMTIDQVQSLTDSVPVLKEHFRVIDASQIGTPNCTVVLLDLKSPQHNTNSSIKSMIDSYIREEMARHKLQLNIDHPVSLRLTNERFFEDLSIENIENTGKNRFFDNDELKYSLRSLHKYAPWVRKIYIVTNGQVPRWLNLKHPKIRIITHKEIFVNQSHLPTFSSSAIETHIHRIPNLSKYFLYFNDDIILGKPIYLDDFITKSRGFRIYLSWPVPNCANGCPISWLNDGVCDKACNSSKCLWDGGDCTNQTIIDKSLNNNETHIVNTFTNNHLYYCASSCLTNWLGDSSCDQVCNNSNCAFDMADCGITNFAGAFPSINIMPGQSGYQIGFDSNIIYLNFSKINHFKVDDHWFRMKIIDASYRNSSCILSAVLNVQHQILTIMFDRNAIKENLIFNLTSSMGKQVSHFNVNLYFDEQKQNSINQTEFDWKSLFNGKQSAKIARNHQNDHNGVKTDKSPGLIDLSKHCPMNAFELPEEIRIKFDLIENHLASVNTTKSSRIFYAELKDLYQKVICESNWNLERMQSQLSDPVQSYFMQSTYKSRRLLDTYADSLIYVNQIYNKEFGREVRKAPAHMAHFMDRDIMYRLQNRFAAEFSQTSSHYIRSGLDMQLAFAYYYFLMSETVNLTFEQIISAYDVDQSGTLNRNELKTLGLRVENTPSLSNKFQNLLNECCRSCDLIQPTQIHPINLTIDDLSECVALKKIILEQFGKTRVNKFEIVNDNDVAFKMLRSNRTLLEIELNQLRIHTKKFICLNDNFDHHDDQQNEQSHELKWLLDEFYTSLFPIKSPFEIDEDGDITLAENNRRQTTFNPIVNNIRIFKNFIYLFSLVNVCTITTLILYYGLTKK